MSNDQQRGQVSGSLLLDVKAVISELRVGSSTVRRWIREGKLPVVRLGRRVLVRREALEQFVRAAEANGEGD